MRIAHLSSAHPFQDTRIFFKECVSLSQNGFETHLVAQGAPDGFENGVYLHSFFQNKRNSLVRKLVNPLFMLSKALKIRANLYHFHDPELIFLGLLLKLFGKRVIYDVHEDYFQMVLVRDRVPPVIKIWIARLVDFLEKRISQYFDAIITATDTIANNFQSFNGRVESVRNFSLEFPLSRNLQNSGTKTIVFAGGLYKTRGLIELVEALNILGDDFSVRLLLCGKPSPQSFIDDLISQDKFKRITYAGVLPYSEVMKLMIGADIGFICDYPEKRNIEGLPIKLFEYMAAGLPVIASNFPSWEAIVEENSCGICVDPLSPVEIADAIRYLFLNTHLAREMGVNGKNASRTKYCWEVEAKKLVDIYTKIIDC